MHARFSLRIAALTIFVVLLFVSSSVQGEAIIADHNAVGDFELIGSSYFDLVRSEADIFYMHTSHGRQILDGLDKLTLENVLYSEPTVTEYSSDAGADWVPYAQSHLNAHPDCNVFIISWCGQLSSDLATRVPAYLEKMSQMEIDYPSVTFVYMTGHIDGTGPDGPLKVNNDQIREYCVDSNKVLFDFADIESYDPDGTHYPWDTDACGWCVDWCATHSCSDDCICAHSHCFNCYIKGKAFWWMMARLWGWNTTVSVGDEQSSGLPTSFALGQNYPNPFNPSTGIVFTLPQTSVVTLQVLNVTGQQVCLLADRSFGVGTHTLTWRPENLASGIYLYRLDTDGFTATRKMVYLK